MASSAISGSCASCSPLLSWGAVLLLCLGCDVSAKRSNDTEVEPEARGDSTGEDADDDGEGGEGQPDDDTPADDAEDVADGGVAGDVGSADAQAGTPDDAQAMSLPCDCSSRKRQCNCSACEEVVDIESAVHVVTPVVYDGVVPAGGDHNPCWATWGVHDEFVPAEKFVHNLEHGGVAFLYSCVDCEEDVAKLEEFVLANELTLLSPFPEMAPRFAVVAWGHRIYGDCLDMVAFKDFYYAHVDQAPEVFGRPPPPPPLDCL